MKSSSYIVHLLWVCLLFTTAAYGAVVNIGMSREAVIASMGEPESQASRGEREFLMYPDGVKIELTGGKVVRVTGMEYGFVTEESRKPATEPTQVPQKKQAEPVTEEEPDSAPKAEATETTVAETAEVYQDMLTETAEETQDEDADLYEDEADYSYEEEAEPPLWLSMSVRLFLKFFLAMVVLKVAFIVYGFPILNRNLIILCLVYALVAIATDAVYDRVEFLGMIPYLDMLVTFLAMTLCVFHFSDVRQGITALQIAAIATVVNWVVGLFFIQAALMLLWGALQ